MITTKSDLQRDPLLIKDQQTQVSFVMLAKKITLKNQIKSTTS